VSRVLPRTLTWLAIALTTGVLVHPDPAAATAPEPELQLKVVSNGPTQGTPVAGAYLTADLGSKNRRVWTAITFMTTERAWGTDGGTVTAYKEKDGGLKELGSAAVARNSAFVRLPWKRAPVGKTRVVVCYDGSDVVEASCSPFDVVRRPDQSAR
jgi:hypothetical protein